MKWTDLWSDFYAWFVLSYGRSHIPKKAEAKKKRDAANAKPQISNEQQLLDALMQVVASDPHKARRPSKRYSMELMLTEVSIGKLLLG